MTISPTVAPAPGQLEAADHRLRLAARRLVRSWAFTFTLAVVITASGLTVFVLIAIWLPFSILTLFCLWYPAAGAYLIFQLVPHASSPPPGVEPSDQDLAWLATWVEQHVNERPRMRLSNDFDVYVDHGYLYVGMALLMGLSEEDLRELVRDAFAQRDVDARQELSFASSLSFGAIGRGLWRRQDARISRWLFRGLLARVAEFHEARREQAMRRYASGVDAQVTERVDDLGEAWGHVVDTWLNPALQYRRWHAEPYSGLAVFLDACAMNGLSDDHGRGRHSSMIDLRPSLRAHERELAVMLVADAPHDEDPIEWDQHPGLVDEARWRAALSEALLMAGRTTGRTVPASFDSLCEAVRDHEYDEYTTALEAASLVTVLDAGVGRLTWEWPLGTVLRDAAGERLLLPEDCDGDDLRAWLIDQGLDPGEPLWIADSAPPVAERALYAFNASVRPRGRRVIFTDRALWSFGYRPSPLAGLADGINGPLAAPDTGMAAIDRGEVPTDTLFKLDWDDIVSARLVPSRGGHRWRLHVRSTRGEAIQVRGLGDNRTEERLLDALLGERLHSRWSWRRPAVRRLRNWFWYLCMGFSGLGLILGGINLISPPEDTTRIDWLEFGAACLVLLALGLLPDAIASLKERRALRKLDQLKQSWMART